MDTPMFDRQYRFALIGYKPVNRWAKNTSTTLSLLCIIFCLLLPTISIADAKADIIWVQKSKRVLHLIKDYKITHSYPIALGQQPVGHKQREGDQRTPEGLYYIDGRNENSKYYLSLHISYPAPQDYLRAVKMNGRPGKLIMLHGEPNSAKHKATLSSATAEDWTAGCIALSNQNMLTLWSMIDTGTPILIDP